MHAPCKKLNRRRRATLPCLWVVLFFWPCLTLAASDPADICDRAARRAAAETNVPLDVLRAVTRTETGRGQQNQMKPWPWTVNMEGRGVWFDTEDQARLYVFRHFRDGSRSFDIGCFQINYKWHGHAFSSIEEMFDPDANAAYAAGFLRELYAEKGDWTAAVGAYHSRTHEYAARYLDRYAEVYEALGPDTSASSLFRGGPAPLISGRSVQERTGSLVPRSEGGGSLFALGTGG